jgi:hypothetical protein
MSFSLTGNGSETAIKSVGSVACVDRTGAGRDMYYGHFYLTDQHIERTVTLLREEI